MKIKQYVALIGVMSAMALVGCTSYDAMNDGYNPNVTMQSGSYAAASRYGQEHCDVQLVQCGWGVNWVAIPTYHQIIVPTIEELPVPEPEIYIPNVPTPETEPVPEIFIPEPDPVLPPIIQEDATPSYPKPPIYVPPPLIRK